MARHRDLPGWLAAVHPRYHVPHHAEIAIGALVCILTATVDLGGVIGFSSFGVLVYYAIANASAHTQPSGDDAGRGTARGGGTARLRGRAGQPGDARRRWPRALNVCGVAGCLLLVATLPWQSVVAGLAVFVIGLAGRAIARRPRR
jgi:APA family basic amino acid/polyamine antiporter